MRRQRRTFTVEFKRQVVEEYLNGERSQAEQCRRYELSPNLVRDWIQKYRAGEFEGRHTTTTHERDLEQRIAALERKVGQLTMENELLKRGAARSAVVRSERSSIVSGPGDSASRLGAH